MTGVQTCALPISSNTDSVTYNHNISKRFRDAVLQMNSTDTYCAEYNDKYEEILPQIDRVVTGKVVDNLNQGKALADISIYGILNDGQKERLGETGTDGSFSIWVNGKYHTIEFSPDNNEDYNKPYTQRLDIGKHYKLFIKLAPRKRQ